MNPRPYLEVKDLFVNYGKVHAVRGLSIQVDRGAVVGILGANGAGKSSTLDAICGNSAGKARGEVRLDGDSVLGRRSDRLVGRGMVLVPEGRRIIAPLTVEENLRLGAYARRARANERRQMDEIYELFPVLRERRDAPGGLLSGGEQQMLAFGRALMANPEIIVMDEPSMGLAPTMVDTVMRAVTQINAMGKSILLVEQNAAATLAVADSVYVVNQGQIVLEGTAEQVGKDTAVIEAFLGVADEDPGHDRPNDELTRSAAR